MKNYRGYEVSLFDRSSGVYYASKSKARRYHGVYFNYRFYFQYRSEKLYANAFLDHRYISIFEPGFSDNCYMGYIVRDGVTITVLSLDMRTFYTFEKGIYQPVRIRL